MTVRRRIRVAQIRSRSKLAAVGAALALVAASVTAVTLGSGTAQAATGRQQLPIVAGTELAFEGGWCTAGLVLQANGVWSNLIQYRAATRYVLTAGHCGDSGDSVRVETDYEDVVAGTVTWKSDVSDLALVEVPPGQTRREQCSVSSFGEVCSIVVDYYPRATGDVILNTAASNIGGGRQTRAVAGTGTPGTDEVFCTSGMTTNVLCTWSAVDHSIRNQPAGAVYAETSASNVVSGDSGGPVVSRSGTVYGIIIGPGRPTSSITTFMAYTTIGQFFSEQSGYSLAPPAS